MLTGDQGRTCKSCTQTEARCAFNYGQCCPGCTHWFGWSANGEPGDPRQKHEPVDEVTAKRRQRWRESYRRKRSA